MHRLLLLVTFFMGFNLVHAQDYWKPASPYAIADKKISPEHTPRMFTVYQLDMPTFKKALQQAPLRGSGDEGKAVEITFPKADGTFETYKVIEAPVMDAQLSARFPDIKSYAGQSIESPADHIRFSVSPKGVRNMLFSPNGYEFMELYSHDLTHYMVYQRKDRAVPSSPFECGVKDQVNQKIEKEGITRNNADDAILRDYRLAVSTTSNYTNYFGGTVADALAAINTSMTRVNGIYETDFNVTMTLINSTTDVIFTSANDPYGGNLNSQLQTQLSNIIGEANYDIGHLFERAGNNGNAGCIGCVCIDGSKGSAFTATDPPEGEIFDVDYLAHEMGHQFGGNHTWTFGGNEGTIAQVEPGSGTTIMSYAGITGNTTDVQPAVDPYFHAVTIQQVTNYIKSNNGGCAIETNTGNAVPVVNAGSDFTIPGGTAFILEGSATDADAGDVLTYCWEQMDDNNANTTLPSPTNTTGVAFRTYNPTTDNFRYLPELNTIRNGSTSSTWEICPTVTRDMNFRLTVRDNRLGGGNNESDDMVVSVDGNSGPFIVSVPDGGEVICPSSSFTVVWDVAGTDQAPVNASTVDILLSTDSGLTYPTVLATGVANTGTASVMMPAIASTTARIMVRGGGNIFFDISNGDFTIQTTTADFDVLANPNSFYTCQAEDAVITVNLDLLCGFSGNVNLSTSGLPVGAVASFSPTVIAGATSSTLTISNIASVSAGTYTVSIDGTGSTGTRSTTIDLIIEDVCSECNNYPSADVPVGVVNGTSVFTSTINIPANGIIDDVIVTDLDMDHTRVGDLFLTLEHGGVSVRLIDRPGVPNTNNGCRRNNIFATFDDDLGTTTAENECTPGTNPVINGTFLPEDPLSAFDGMDMTGTWTLRIEDFDTNEDQGTLNDWSLDICASIPNLCATNLAIPDLPIATGVYQTSNLISSTGQVANGTQVTFDAGNCIELNADFEVELGAEFDAFINGCQ